MPFNWVHDLHLLVPFLTQRSRPYVVQGVLTGCVVLPLLPDVSQWFSSKIDICRVRDAIPSSHVNDPPSNS